MIEKTKKPDSYFPLKMFNFRVSNFEYLGMMIALSRTFSIHWCP